MVLERQGFGRAVLDSMEMTIPYLEKRALKEDKLDPSGI